jgi:hypothetical protein
MMLLGAVRAEPLACGAEQADFVESPLLRQSPFGRSGDVLGHQTGSRTLNTMTSALTAANPQDQGTFAMMNVFQGKPIAAGRARELKARSRAESAPKRARLS